MEPPRGRKQLLDAAACEIARHGYTASSLASIAGNLGLTKGALVRHFPAKEDIAWAIIGTLRDVIAEERARSKEVYPEHGIRAMIRFLLSVGARAAQEPQIAAGVVLFTDRASPTFEVAEVREDWISALHHFLKSAHAGGELGDEPSPRELADYIFIMNMGEAIFGARTYTSEHATQRLRFMRITLRNAGVRDADAMIDEVFSTCGASSLEKLPARAGLNPTPRQ